MKTSHQTIQAAVVFAVGILLMIFFKAPNEDKQKSNFESSSKSVGMTKFPNALVPVLTIPDVAAKKLVPIIPSKRLLRFEELKGKVLLGQTETNEKEALLSDLKMIEWISTTLTKFGSPVDFKDRLSMIDFLEEATTWKDNPARENVLRTISDVILSEAFVTAPHEAKRQLVGDKIELFTILSEEAPQEAATLKVKTQGTNLEPILSYAARRLPVNSAKSEVRQ